VQALGWRYLFRVQNHTKVLTRKQHYVPLKRLVHKPGQRWSGYGVVFKQRGHLRAYVHVVWATGQAEPWCLVTNDSFVDGAW
jgi:transposase InsO family protein